jgi:hypothetical protein
MSIWFVTFSPTTNRINGFVPISKGDEFAARFTQLWVVFLVCGLLTDVLAVPIGLNFVGVMTAQ